MRFYTNVHQRFNEILVRGYENGRHFTTKETFHPTFYVPSKKESKYKTLDGQSVEPINQVKYLIVRNLMRSILVYRDLMSMGMTGTSVSIFLRNIQRMRLSLI